MKQNRAGGKNEMPAFCPKISTTPLSIFYILAQPFKEVGHFHFSPTIAMPDRPEAYLFMRQTVPGNRLAFAFLFHKDLRWPIWGF